MEKNSKTKPNDLSLKDKCIAYCRELPFGIVFFSSYIETMNIIPCDVEINEYELLDIKSDKRDKEKRDRNKRDRRIKIRYNKR